ncbi:plasmid mobilization relaxosome protein MobC [Rhodomicrobium vannielii ATCC 17100]|nr:plasmid mobilization relaxosome protein MobC [Rhodomicrobium vannielii ATCC 17100]
MAKSRKPKVRTKLVSIRVTERDHELLFERAQKAGFTLSEFARAKLLCDPTPPTRPVAPEDISTEATVPLSPEAYAARQLADQVRRIGINLNQIAHRLNMLDQPMPSELPPLLTDIRRYMQLIWARERR